MTRTPPRLAAAALALLLGAALLPACKKEEPAKPTTALEDVKKLGDDAVKASNDAQRK